MRNKNEDELLAMFRDKVGAAEPEGGPTPMSEERALTINWRGMRASTAPPLVTVLSSASSVRLNPSIRNRPIGSWYSSATRREEAVVNTVPDL